MAELTTRQRLVAMREAESALLAAEAHYAGTKPRSTARKQALAALARAKRVYDEARIAYHRTREGVD